MKYQKLSKMLLGITLMGSLCFTNASAAFWDKKTPQQLAHEKAEKAAEQAKINAINKEIKEYDAWIKFANGNLEKIAKQQEAESAIKTISEAVKQLRPENVTAMEAKIKGALAKLKTAETAEFKILAGAPTFSKKTVQDAEAKTPIAKETVKLAKTDLEDNVTIFKYIDAGLKSLIAGYKLAAAEKAKQAELGYSAKATGGSHKDNEGEEGN